eukprot:GFUD01019914.1.p1 GENE.GFUD01019914.1~~GFUD01019914.1.p1  ORF type:complete len:109 (-),score=32.78 GFUD01019914.1:121-447(-)
MPRAAKEIDKDDPEYQAKRAKNNAAIKRTREKAKAKAGQIEMKVENLKTDNKRMEDQINVLDREMEFLKDIYNAHTQTTTQGPSGPHNTHVQESGNDIESLDKWLTQI